MKILPGLWVLLVAICLAAQEPQPQPPAPSRLPQVLGSRRNRFPRRTTHWLT